MATLGRSRARAKPSVLRTFLFLFTLSLLILFTRNTDVIRAVKPTILPDDDVPTDGAMADAVAADKMVDTITGTMDNAQQ